MILDARVSKMKKKFDPSVVCRERGDKQRKLGFNPLNGFFLHFFGPTPTTLEKNSKTRDT